AESPRQAEVRSDLAAPLEPRFTFDTFIVGKPNEFAYACARRGGKPAPGRGAQRPCRPARAALYV
ncbi:hypothetical protein HNW77_09185, partial [Komagataeibacter sp. AV436]|nr:hypothetical protein [Komagataeibacter melomenusus]